MNKTATHSQEDLADLELEYQDIHRRYVLVLSVALGLLILGAIVYHQLLHLSWIDAFYFCTTTLATVGYGDITPTTDVSKIFTIFYVIIGIGIFTTFASLLVRNASLRRELRKAKRHQQ
jgi:hypothetical protein